MKLIATNARAFAQPMALLCIALGALLFALRIPLPADGPVNLPMAVTVLQVAGLVFSIFGVQMIASMVFWPDLKVSELLSDTREGKASAGYTLAGLLVFNGLCFIGICYWLASAMGAGLAGGR